MQIVRESKDLDSAVLNYGADGERIAFVPTMGALHAGHLYLVEEARRLADRVVVSIFVNPLQFNDQADLDHYPRQEAADLAKLEQAGCDIAWLPTSDSLYPEGFATTVHVAGVSDRWEGEHRPGHFDGVATVVAKLLNAVVPDMALFGEKDFQQLAVIRRMARDLALCDDIVGVATVREDDGLALSSRNLRLSAAERERAPALYQALVQASDAIANGQAVDEALSAACQTVRKAGFASIDYLALVDGTTLEPLDRAIPGARLIAAATLGTTRLIDNLPLQRTWFSPR